MQDFSWESIWVNMQKEKIAEEARFNVNKKILFDLFRKNNVESVFVSFEGSGDSGGINIIEFSPENKQPLIEETIVEFNWSNNKDLHEYIEEKMSSVKDAIENICYNMLGLKNNGWETDHGSYGNITFDVDSEKIILEFNLRTSQEYNYEF